MTNPVNTYYAMPAEPDGWLDPARVREVLGEYPEGFSAAQLAERFGVPTAQMSTVLQTLKHEGLIWAGGTNIWNLVPPSNGTKPPDRIHRAVKTNRKLAMASGRWGGTKEDRRRIREWANANGFDQSATGQLKAKVVAAYYEAHPGEQRLDGKTNWPKAKPRSGRKPSSPRRSPARKTTTDEIEVLRVYRHGELTVQMHQDGIAEVSTGKQQSRLWLTAEQWRSLVKIAERVEEMNRVMGL